MAEEEKKTQISEPLLAPEQYSSPTKKAYFRAAFKIGIILSAFTLLILTLGPFEYPLALSFVESLIAGIFLINSIVSLCFYVVEVKKKYDSRTEPLAPPPEEEESRWSGFKNRHRRFFSVFGKFVGSYKWVIFMGVVGLVIGGLLAAFSPSGVNPVMRLLLIPFTCGGLLSFACRMDVTKKNMHEVIASWTALLVVLMAVAVGLISMPIDSNFLVTPLFDTLDRMYKVWGPYLPINAALAIIGFAQYFAKGVSVFFRENSWDWLPSRERRWENLLAAGSFIVSAIITGLIWGYHPTTDLGQKFLLSIAVFSACASLAAKFGKGLDEAEDKEQKKMETLPSKTWSNRITKHPFWHYVIRPTLTVGLFVMFGFGLLGASVSMGGTGSLRQDLILPWALQMPTFSFSLLALSVSIIANLSFHWLKPSVLDIPTCKTVESAKEAVDLLVLLTSEKRELSDKEVDLLLTHIRRAEELFSSRWRDSFPDAPASGLFEENIEGGKNAHFERLQKIQSGNDIRNNKSYLLALFSWLQGPDFEVDPTYRPPASALTYTAGFLSLLLLSLSLGTLFSILSGIIPSSGISWSLPVTVLFGFGAWISGSYYLDNTSGRFRPAVTAIFSITAITSFLLFIFTQLPHNFVLNPVLSPDILFLSSLVSLFLLVAGRSEGLPEKLGQFEKSYSKFSKSFLRGSTVTLVAATITFLVIANFLSIAVLLSFSELGGLLGASSDNLLEVAINFLSTQATLNVGIPWLVAFNIAFVITINFVGFEFIKGRLKQAPANAADLKSFALLKKAIPIVLTLALILPIFIVLFAKQGMLGPGSDFPLVCIFLVTTVAIPILFGNSKLSWPVKTSTAKLLAREGLTLSILTGIAALLAAYSGASPELATPVLAISAVTTLLFRWGRIKHFEEQEREADFSSLYVDVVGPPTPTHHLTLPLVSSPSTTSTNGFVTPPPTNQNGGGFSPALFPPATTPLTTVSESTNNTTASSTVPPDQPLVLHAPVNGTTAMS